MPTSGQTASPVPPPSGGVSLPVSVANGGTGAATAANARTNLNVPSIPVSVANGGTGATDAPTARSNLGIVGAGGWPSGVFGAASDGSIDFDGTATFAFATKAGSVYTLSRNVWAQNVTIRAGVTVNKPWVLYVRGTLTIEATGILADNGNAAIGSAAGAQAGATRIPGSVGGAGAAGRTAGTSGSGTSAVTVTNGHGGVGGYGGDPNTVHTGGNGGSVSAPGITANRIRDGLAFLGPFVLQTGTGQIEANGGSGGGAGGLFIGTGTGISGGSGGGAPVSVLFAATIANSGKIQNNGGAGANAVSATLDAQSGGGGGGGGGYFIIVSNTPQASAGTIEVLGGAGGTSLGTGCANALPGNDGTLDYRGP